MATNYKQSGKILTVAAPYDRTSGQGALIGSLFGVALGTVLSGATGDFQTSGVFSLNKEDAVSGQAFAVGQKVYWDNSNKECNADPTVGPLIGVATEAALTGATSVVVRLNGVAPAMPEGPQTAIADLTFGTNITAATANGALTDSSATNPTDAQFNELAKELGTKINAILAALRTTGVIASS